MNAKTELLDKIGDFESKLYHPDIHQVTIDMTENIYEEVSGYDKNSGLTFETMIGSLLYLVENLIEICDKNLYDHGLLIELKNILEPYVIVSRTN